MASRAEHAQACPFILSDKLMEIHQLARPPFAAQCAVTQVAVTVSHHVGNPIRHESQQMLGGTYGQFQNYNFGLAALAGMR